ncbi:MAG: 1-acyl-sn-glycerol-3-phosphate acyltransferase [Prevotellaceae bacterium]|jgi:putative hemolysin|nr:1-acyl-sn-glycerol-3-phosphate acyltransferase [Prevotellaceae bacterium]
MSDEQVLLDIPKILKSKSPKLAKWLPRFVVRYIERKLHVEELNYILTTFGHLDGVEFDDAALEYLGIKHTVINPELLPPNDGKRYIFVSNHPLGGLDGMVLISALGAQYNNDVRFIVNDLLYNLKPLRSVFVPVNKHGRQLGDYVDMIDQAYASDNQVLYFPAGLCSRKIKGKIQDLPWKKSIVTKAIKYERDIVPIYFEGRNSNFFYNLDRVGRFFGIKANIAMFYLSDELFKQRNSHFNLIAGPPIPYTTFDKSESATEWAAYLREVVYSIPAKNK